MAWIEFFKNEYLSLIAGGLGGILSAAISAIVIQKITNKRGIFRYFVTHNRVGISTQDSVFGNVEVKWNNIPTAHLYLSTIELKNESLIDYENITINTFTDNTQLLTESTQVLDTPNRLDLTLAYRDKIAVNPGETPSDLQMQIYHGQREYFLPVFNRGQIVKIDYLNSANSEKMPNIWLSATVKGVKVKFLPPHEVVYGVQRGKAALIGSLIGLVGVLPLVSFISNSWVIAYIALAYGYLVLIPGATVIHAFRKIRDAIGS